MFTTVDVLQGQFLAQYCGELISHEEGDAREAIAETGFRYFFQHRGSHYWYTLMLAYFCNTLHMYMTTAQHRHLL